MFRRNPMEKMLKKAQKCLEKKKFVEAKNIYLKCLAMEPDNVGVLNNLAQLYLMFGETGKSEGYNEILLKECNRLLEYGKEETLLMLKTNALSSLHRLDELNEALDDLLEISPKNIIGLLQKSQYLEMTHKHREALTYIDRILKEKPYEISALLSKGRNLVELNEFEKAEDCYNLVFKIETKNKAAINLKSQLLKKKYDSTITAHDFMLKAIENWDNENFNASTEFFKKAINLSDQYDEIWFAQGELFVRTGRIGDAINSFERAFELDANSGGIDEQEEFFKMLNRMKKISTILGFEK